VDSLVAKKTYKRELAVALLVWLIYVVEVKDVTIVEVLVWPIFAFVGAAFGFDAYSKQLWDKSSESFDRRGTQRSSERTGRENQQSDSGYYDK
jgi:hypothetical protein